MNFCVLGAGAWGTAMALHLIRQGHSVTLVPRRIEMALALASSRENTDYLPGFHLPLNLQVGFEVKPVLMEADVAILACPSKGLRPLCESIAQHLGSAQALKLIVTLCKGLEEETFLRPGQVVGDALPEIEHAVLSGPTNAAEVAAGKPTAVTLGSNGVNSIIEMVQAAMSGGTLRVYTSEDMKGVELGGCLKNIYAIAAGCVDGLQFGDNAKAALMTRSLNEMIRLGVALGADAKTFFGLSGFGDLVATCNGSWSRNRTLGQELGAGKTLEALMSDRKTVVEGVTATKVFHSLCEQKGIEAPILNQVYAVLYEGLEPERALKTLMLRDLKAE
ncbi:MAG: NAD(P)-dependent glycerol-3-phosphate dehydrogenase [Verrucomicrobia bacterium]|nr:NAD(P)-dependent glycerol-3-phosphate dehydrogenase [Verrucomicrobiota bacterium]MDA1067629.1 NAD(P)-dependent glycerol-3-phosphate dehydrogenase [Verrucomicrobiota bacterium]